MLPIEAISQSCLSFGYIINGNDEIQNEIKALCQQEIGQNVCLYDAQEKIREYLCQKYGISWYEKSAEAVQFIIENTYADKEREITAFLFYQKNKGVLYD